MLKMELYKIIKLFYVAYTVYAILLINCTSLQLTDVLPAIILMWILFFAYGLGVRLKNRPYTIQKTWSTNSDSWLLRKNKTTLLLIALISIISAILAADFYTGQTPISTIKALLTDNRSLYMEYQNHAEVQEVGVFRITKIPFILMMFIVKVTLLYSFISFLIAKKNITVFDKFFLLLVSASHVYFGLARGTNFELFEIVVLIIFVVIVRSKQKQDKKIRIPIITFLIISAAVSIMIFLFYSRISNRGVVFDYQGFQDFTYDPQGIVATISPFLSFVILIIYDYFGLGFVYMSKYITEIWFSSINFLIAGFTPYGYVALEGTNIQDIIYNYIFIGHRWHPDVSFFINKFGFLGVMTICIGLGLFSAYTYKQEKSSLTYLTQFLILMQMISLPTGNFIFVSSASTLTVVLVIGIWLWKIFSRKKHFQLIKHAIVPNNTTKLQ